MVSSQFVSFEVVFEISRSEAQPIDQNLSHSLFSGLILYGTQLWHQKQLYIDFTRQTSPLRRRVPKTDNAQRRGIDASPLRS